MSTARTPSRIGAALGAAGFALASLAGPAAVAAAPEAAQATITADYTAEMFPVVSADGFARAVIAYDDATIPAGTLDLMTELGVVRGLELPTIGAVAVTAAPELVADLANRDGVLAAYPQRRLVLDLDVSKGQINALPEDLSQPEPYTRGDVTGERPAVDGSGVGVAVLDSGIFAPHPDFLGRATTGFHFTLSEIQDSGGISYEQWDNYAIATGPIALQDEIGHGTHVASTVGGSGVSAAAYGDRDLAGVAPGTTLYSFKVATAPFGIADDFDWEEAALASFDFIIRRNEEYGIRVAQNSWGLLETEPNCLGFCANIGEITDFDGMKVMTEAVHDAGVTVVFSAGNDGRDGEGTVPIFKGHEKVITTAAACRATGGACEDGGITNFSSHGLADLTGPQVDIAAPGDTIMAATSPSILLPLTECETDTALYPGYYCISGTSMATPHISGVVALLYEANPDITPGEVKECITSTAVDMLTPGFDNLSGHGMADTRAALACAHALTVTPAADETPSPAPEPTEDPTPAPEPEPTQDELPATGGGMALVGMVAVASATVLRRR